jgi:transposase
MSNTPNFEGFSLETLLSVFTREEREIIESMCASGHANDIVGRIQIFDPEREYKLEAIIALLAPKEVVVDSEVKKELEQEIAKGFKIETPEQEAEWQKKIDAENKKNEERANKEKARILRNLESVKKATSSEGKEVTEEAPKRRGRPAKKEVINEQPSSDTTVVDA